MRADLHVHSNASDGTDPPAEVMRRAARAGLDAVALTDHDTVAGHAEARPALPRGPDPGAWPGTVRPASRSQRAPAGVPVRPGPTPNSPPNSAGSATTGCCGPGPWWAGSADLGVDISWDQVAAIAGDAVVGRPHIARAMAASGAIAAPRDAFTRDWIADGGRAYVDRYALDPGRAIRLVRGAGGAAVLAHPRAGREYAVSDEQIAGLAAVGLAGVEVFHPDQPDAERARLLALGHDLGLLATGGSDDHGSLTGYRIGAETAAAGVYEALVAQTTGSRPVTRA